MIAAQATRNCLQIATLTEQRDAEIAEIVQSRRRIAALEAQVNPRPCQNCEGPECEKCDGSGFHCVGCATYSRAADIWQALLKQARTDLAPFVALAERLIAEGYHAPQEHPLFFWQGEWLVLYDSEAKSADKRGACKKCVSALAHPVVQRAVKAGGA